jgi:hypothetical protein
LPEQRHDDIALLALAFHHRHPHDAGISYPGRLERLAETSIYIHLGLAAAINAAALTMLVIKYTFSALLTILTLIFPLAIVLWLIKRKPLGDSSISRKDKKRKEEQ